MPFVKLVNGMEYVIKSASKVCIKNIFNRIEEMHLLIITTSTVPPSAVPRYALWCAFSGRYIGSRLSRISVKSCDPRLSQSRSPRAPRSYDRATRFKSSTCEQV